MSRRRYISTDISTDAQLAMLAQDGPLPLLIYTWAIPHMDDWGRMTGDALQFKLLVCPALDVTAMEVERQLNRIAEVGLWTISVTTNGKRLIQIPSKRWFREQWHLKGQIRRKPWKRVSARVRPIVFARDSYRCRACGSTEHLEADHIIPISKGGGNELDNLQTLCRPCNRRKGAKLDV